MRRNRIRLSESALNRIVRNSVRRVLREDAEIPSNFMEYDDGEYDLGNHRMSHKFLGSNDSQTKYRYYMSVVDENGNEVAKAFNQGDEDSAKWTAYECYQKLCRQLGITPAGIGR